MRKLHYYCMMTLVAILLVACLGQSAHALPAFARRAGGVSCTMCHWDMNSLNRTGIDFLRQGLRLPGEEANVNDPDMKFGNYTSLVLNPNFSAVKDGSTKFSAGNAILWLAGPVDSRFSTVAEIEFKIDSEEVEVEEVYGQYISNPGDRYYSARMGQFQPFLFFTQVSGPIRTTLSRPTVMSGRSTNGNSFRPRDRVRGVEFGAISGPLSGYVGVGNGPGQNTSDNHMDVYATVEQEIGPLGSSIGAWTYWGEAVLPAPAAGFRDAFRRSGVIGNYTSPKTRVVAAFLFGEDGNPGGRLDNEGWFVEVDRKLRENVIGYFRWDEFEADLSGGGKRKTDGPSIGATWTPSELTRLAMELQFLDTDGTSSDSVTIEFQIAL